MTSKMQPSPKDHDGIKIELGVERAFDIFGLTKAVLLTGKEQVADGDLFAL